MDDSDIDGSRRIYEMTRMGSMPVITKDMILDPQTDFDDLLDFADELNVNMAGIFLNQQAFLNILFNFSTFLL